MKAKLEQRVRESRAKIAAAARGKQSGVADVLMDMVRSQLKTCQPPGPLRRAAEDARRRSAFVLSADVYSGG